MTCEILGATAKLVSWAVMPRLTDPDDPERVGVMVRGEVDGRTFEAWLPMPQAILDDPDFDVGADARFIVEHMTADMIG